MFDHAFAIHFIERNASNKMPRTAENDRLRAVGMLESGTSVSATARQFGVARQTVRLWYHRHRMAGTVSDLPRSGRPRVTTRQQDRYILLTHLRNRFHPATATAAAIPGLRRISSGTVRNRLREQGLHARRPAVRPVLQPRHRVARLAWARQHIPFRNAQWDMVLFTDECRITLNRADGRQRVYRRQGERFADNCIQEHDRQGGGGIMVWGGISTNQRTQLVIIEGNLTGLRYRDEVVRNHIAPFVLNHGPGVVLQQDNARPHVARVVQDELQVRNIQTLPWPANSPDLSPIEHLWDELKRRVRQRQHPPTNLRELREAVVQEWQNIPQRSVRLLVRSMRRRCQAVIDARGGHTRY